MTALLILGIIALLLIPYLWRKRPTQDAVDETRAYFDALQAIDDEVAKDDVRAKAHEAALRAADAAVMAKYGPKRECGEL